MTGPATVETVERPEPRADVLADGEVLLRVLAGGLCGSDGPFFRRGVGRTVAPGRTGDPPPAPMHEVVGEVVASRSEFHEVGDRVVGWLESFAALQALVVGRGTSLYRYDRSLSPESAVALQPIACVLYAVDCIGDVRDRECTVLGQGAIGMLFSHVLAARGARVTGVDPIDRSAQSSAFGVDRVVTEVSTEWAREVRDSGGEGADLVVEAVGHQVSTLRDALELTRPGGRIFYFGIPDDEYYPINMEQMMRKNLTLMSGFTPFGERRRALAAADGYVRSHPDLPDELVTHRFGLDEVTAAYRTAFVPAVGKLKVVITTGAG
jgi:threonine dehydrogenase-like Zn-dependent dehydrogenase